MPQDSSNIDRRVAARVAIERDVSVAREGHAFAGRTVNVSTSGVLVALAGTLTIWADVEIEMPEIGRRAARVARHDGSHYGLVFREPLSAAEFAELTGTEVVVDDSSMSPACVKPAGRTAPWAFGRDKLKTLRREAAERARLPDR